MLSVTNVRLVSLPVACSRKQAPEMVRRAILDKPLSTRYEKVSDIIYMSRMAGRAAQQHVLVGYLEIGQMVTTLRSSIPDHKLNTKFWPPLYQTRALQRNCRQSPCSRSSRLFSSQNKTTTATNPCSHHVELERQRSPLRSAQRRRATELCPHRPASRSSTLYLSVTWDEQQRAYRRRTQYERKHTSHGLCRKRRRRSRLRAAFRKCLLCSTCCT